MPPKMLFFLALLLASDTTYVSWAHHPVFHICQKFLSASCIQYKVESQVLLSSVLETHIWAAYCGRPRSYAHSQLCRNLQEKSSPAGHFHMHSYARTTEEHYQKAWPRYRCVSKVTHGGEHSRPSGRRPVHLCKTPPPHTRTRAASESHLVLLLPHPPAPHVHRK